MPGLTVPHRPTGIVGVYDASTDWTPIYDRTALPGYYVAMGTSGNQFKNAPVVGQLMAGLIAAVECGHDHDRDPLVWRPPDPAAARAVDVLAAAPGRPGRPHQRHGLSGGRYRSNHATIRAHWSASAGVGRTPWPSSG